MRIFLTVLLLVVGPNHVAAEEVYRASDKSVLLYMERDLEAGSHWYGAYFTDIDGVDHKLGYMSVMYNKVQTKENKSLFGIDAKMSLNFKSLGNIHEILFDLKDLYNAEPPFNLLTSQLNTKTSDMISSNFTFFQEKILNYTSFSNGIRTNFLKPDIEIGLRDIYSPDEWIDNPSIKIGDYIYSNELSDGILDKSKYTLTDIKNEIIGGVEYEYFKLSTSTDPEKILLDDMHLYKDEKNWIKLTVDFGDNFILDFRLEPEERAIDLDNLADLYVLNSIFVTEVSKKFINYYGDEETKAKNVWYEIIGEDNGLIETNYPRKKKKKTDDGRRFLVIGYGSDERQAEEFKYEAVQDSAYNQVKEFKDDNPELAEISARLVDEAKSHTNTWSLEEEIIRRIRTFVSEYIQDEYIYYDVSDPYVILEERKGDCTEHAVLFNALLKAAGIPARSAFGYLLGDDSGAFGAHAWSEVAYDGHWIPVDATWDVWVENSVNHIKTREGINLLSKNFKLNLHKINYKDGSSEVYN